jgi:YfiH family protein
MKLTNRNIWFGISEKKDGPIKYSEENRLLFFKNNNLAQKVIISAGLVDGNQITIVDGLRDSQIIPNCDALISSQEEQLLTITVADCLPIYFYDAQKKVVALAHAGWRGVLSLIAPQVIEKMKEHYHSQADDIIVIIGPHIQACHFEVKNDVARQFKDKNLTIKDGKTFINLAQVVSDQLIQAQVPIANIKVSSECTYCLSDKYFSYRRDRKPELETMIAYIGLK